MFSNIGTFGAKTPRFWICLFSVCSFNIVTFGLDHLRNIWFGTLLLWPHFGERQSVFNAKNDQRCWPLFRHNSSGKGPDDDNAEDIDKKAVRNVLIQDLGDSESSCFLMLAYKYFAFEDRKTSTIEFLKILSRMKI